ncbi:MAG: lytic transglycosylase domain-containing protein [Caulobacteraceae bacterium]|nr:lytic transglycosylase domain-containing protein [Caulobacteraceae bacterium]
MTFLSIKIGAWFITGLAAFTLLWDASKPSESHLQTTGQVTTVLNSVVPSTIAPTTTLPYKGCMEYLNDAIVAGWPITESETIIRVMQRESACNPLAYNPRDSNGGSRGLFQVNSVHDKWLKEAGIITHRDDLFRPDVNIIAALHLWRMVGWSAWALPNP